MVNITLIKIVVMIHKSRGWKSNKGTKQREGRIEILWILTNSIRKKKQERGKMKRKWKKEAKRKKEKGSRAILYSGTYSKLLNNTLQIVQITNMITPVCD